MQSIVYKFTRIREDFFENRLLKFTTRWHLNDPFEVRPSFSQHAAYVHRVNGYGSSVDAVIEEMERNQFLNLMGISFQDFDMYGILSLTETNINLLMWSHYADNHNGIAIGFDSSHDFFDATKSSKENIRNSANDYIGLLKNVRYSASRKMKSDNLNEMFFLKSNDWWTEREVRFVLPAAEADKIELNDRGHNFLYEVPSDAIISITFGLRVSKDEVQRIMKKMHDLRCYNHVEFYQAKMSNETYDLIIEPINYSFRTVLLEHAPR